ncbi:hypothetical protein Pan216_03870 [Planctomycetes bacterium Pan216]|uniref:DoxX n=1 Tax=Kolteria novifilia TaxID=2527975 RepID=A0A518AXV1_9BACT|nr:hypothetical protein Pan216_03870 [Planctomycetes bacterium Pan216]
MNGLTKFLLVLLRIAIGWHLLYEGVWKLDETYYHAKPFSAEMYLRNSTGPMRDYFRGLVDDFHGHGWLDGQVVTDRWKAEAQTFEDFYAFDQSQVTAVDKDIAELSQKVNDYLAKEETAKEIASYKEAVAKWEEEDATPSPSFERDRLKKSQGKLFAEQRELVGPVKEWDEEFHRKLIGTRTDEQQKKGLPPVKWQERSKLDQINLTTMWGLAILGGCLVLGLFSRLSALGAVGLLAMFYLSMPPWPGLPLTPKAEGHYLIVNKNLIEMFALLVLATVPTGVWGGLDALIRAFITRPLFGIGKEPAPAEASAPSEEASK